MEKRRSPLVALLLGLLAPGLGQLYCGRLLTALLFLLLAYGGWLAFLLSFGLAGSGLGTALWAFALLATAGWLGGMVHSVLVTVRSGNDYRLRWYNTPSVYLLAWLAGLVLPNWGLVHLVRGNLLTTVVLVADSMRPNLLPGDAVLLDLRASSRAQLERGSLVAVRDQHHGGELRVLRLVGLPGEQVRLLSDGLEINGRQLPFEQQTEASYARRNASGVIEQRPVVRAECRLGDDRHQVFLERDPARRRTAGWQLGPDQVLALGDNLAEAQALNVEPFPRAALLGRVLLVRFSRDPLSGRWRRERRRLRVH